MLGTSRRKRGGRGGAPYGFPEDAKIVLHVGCGQADPRNLHTRYREEPWRELRLDVDPGVRPDIIGSMTDMVAVDACSVDAIWSHHNIEHVFAHEVPVALREFFRVLKPRGEVLLSTPDLQRVAQFVASGRLDEPIYSAPAGGITPLDVIFGHGASIAEGSVFMAHRTGFTMRTLAHHLERAGFADVSVTRGSDYTLWAEARRPGR